MTEKEILEQLDIEDGDFSYFEQFAALMESPLQFDEDEFAEILLMADGETMHTMVGSFFDDIIRGVPDNDTQLYGSLQTIREHLTGLALHLGDRGAGFFSDELYRFREWYLSPDSVVCTPEAGGDHSFLTPCEALMLYREEKLSGTKYQYDFSRNMPPEPDEYVIDMLAELDGDYTYDDGFRGDDEEEDFLPDELPADYDPSTYEPGQFGGSSLDFDPYVDGFIDRHHPVIDSEDEPEDPFFS